MLAIDTGSAALLAAATTAAISFMVASLNRRWTRREGVETWRREEVVQAVVDLLVLQAGKLAQEDLYGPLSAEALGEIAERAREPLQRIKLLAPTLLTGVGSLIEVDLALERSLFSDETSSHVGERARTLLAIK